ncbi:hypothetical protein QR680_010990 [Steinernema hermaphroditum]|uniref:Peptidase A1 domain-containing protein n=1 Tax=Steinernema hermaphroditum TaxID=289476 RepID=A0AA39IS55_9BILA|nr:hypothetical protein QR680_010990 [Steinernema hermaphroditum]
MKTTMSILLALVLLDVAFCAVHQVHLTRVESGKERMIRKGLFAKYLQQAEESRLVAKGGSVPVNSYDDIEYQGNITVGSQNKIISVYFDTGSATTWVVDERCGKGQFKPDECPDSCYSTPWCRERCEARCCSQCLHMTRFDSSKSTTFKPVSGSFSFTRMGVRVSGIFGTDTLSIGNQNAEKLTIVDTTFGLATRLASVSGQWWSGYGILGLSADSPVIKNIIEQQALDEPVITAYLKNANVEWNGHPGGTFTFGGLDTTNCGPVIDYENFNFNIKNVRSGNYHNNNEYTTTTDTGAGFIGGPVDLVDGLARAAGVEWGTAKWGEEGYFADCSAVFPEIHLTIGDKDYTISKDNYVRPTYNNNQCRLSFKRLDSAGFGPQIVLGTPFIKEYCNVFDYAKQRVGFAKAL